MCPLIHPLCYACSLGKLNELQSISSCLYTHSSTSFILSQTTLCLLPSHYHKLDVGQAHIASTAHVALELVPVELHPRTSCQVTSIVIIAHSPCLLYTNHQQLSNLASKGEGHLTQPPRATHKTVHAWLVKTRTAHGGTQEQLKHVMLLQLHLSQHSLLNLEVLQPE